MIFIIQNSFKSLSEQYLFWIFGMNHFTKHCKWNFSCFSGQLGLIPFRYIFDKSLKRYFLKSPNRARQTQSCNLLFDYVFLGLNFWLDLLSGPADCFMSVMFPVVFLTIDTTVVYTLAPSTHFVFQSGSLQGLTAITPNLLEPRLLILVFVFNLLIICWVVTLLWLF